VAKGDVTPLVEAAFGVHCFPHRLSFLLDNPLRSFLIPPRTLVERLSLPPDARVLELGAGPGFFSVALARQVPLGRLEVVDLQPEMLAKARRRLQRAGLTSVGLTQAEAGALPFPDASFDVVLLVAVLGEVPDARRCLRSVWRALRAGGVAAFHEHWPDPDRIEPAHLRRVVESEGFLHRRSYGRRYNYTAIFAKSE
jgi:ubiquinone/menaquinone biosynthesis C-methylase UbiE